MNPTHSTQRFSNRVADYVKYRPTYPAALLDGLTHDGILSPTSIIADIGSGTGLLAKLFLDAGHQLFGIEPNPDMRRAGEAFLAPYPRFHSTPGTAEATSLPDHSVDLVTAGQPFHWFNRPAARVEFTRILRPPTATSPTSGHAALIWNERKTDTSPFLAAYEKLLHDFSTDYAAVDHRRMTAAIIQDFFAPHPCTLRTYPNHQIFDYAGLQGRLLSSSYAPPAGHPDHQPMLAALHSLFQQHQVNGQVTFDYITEVYTGRLRP